MIELRDGVAVARRPRYSLVVRRNDIGQPGWPSAVSESREALLDLLTQFERLGYVFVRLEPLP